MMSDLAIFKIVLSMIHNEQWAPWNCGNEDIHAILFVCHVVKKQYFYQGPEDQLTKSKMSA